MADVIDDGAEKYDHTTLCRPDQSLMDKVVACDELGTVIQHIEWMEKSSQADINTKVIRTFDFNVGTAESMDSESVDIAVSV